MMHHKLLRFMRDPLFHFMVLGAALFLGYAVVNGSAGESTDRIVIDETQVLRLAQQFHRTWLRPPTEQEMRGLAEDYVKEEILYREVPMVTQERAYTSPIWYT